MLEELSREHRMLLLKFVCAFAWTDLRIRDSERRFVERLLKHLSLSPDELKEVEGWLAVAPSPNEVDPSLVPKEHRHTFVEAARAMIYADGEIDDEERAQLERLKAALSD